MPFQSEFLFRRLSDFWSFFQEREDVANIWDAYLRKGRAMESLLRQADLSKSLATIPIFDRSELEYFVFGKLTRRTDLETNPAFWVFEIDPEIFYIRDLNEKIDDLASNRILSPPDSFEVFAGAGADEGKAFVKFHRGVAPRSVGETAWFRGSDVVTGAGFQSKTAVDDIIQGQDKKFYRITEVTSDTAIKVQGPTVTGEDLGPGGAPTVRQLAAASDVIASSVRIFFDGVELASGFTATALGVVTFSAAPPATVQIVSADYHLGYISPSAANRRTVVESKPARLFSNGVYRDRRSVFTNFGFAIDHDKPTSIQYRNEVRGLYFARFNGPSTTNIDLGSGILIGLPFSQRGKVDRVIATPPKAVIVDGTLQSVPDALGITVTSGQKLVRDFELLTDGVRTVDFINDPAFFALEPIKSNPAKFFTFYVLVKGSYAQHILLTTGQLPDWTTLKDFQRVIKPSYTDFAILTHVDDVADFMDFFIGAVDVTDVMDVSATLEFNGVNFSIIPSYLSGHGFADEDALVADGSWAMDRDSVGLYEGIDTILDSIFIDTLENNLPNFGVGGADAMDLGTVVMSEAFIVQESVGGAPGATLYQAPP